MKCPVEAARVFGCERNTRRWQWRGDQRADFVEPGGVDHTSE